MFQIVKHYARVSHINVREEKHGDETIVAMDVKMTMDSANEYLNDLQTGLLEALYAPHQTQGSLDGRLVTKRFPMLGPVTWEGEGDYDVTFHIEPETDQEFSLAGPINKVSIACKDGGTIITSFRLQISPADGGIIATLSEMLGQDVKISIEPTTLQPATEKKEPGLFGDADE